MSPLKILVLFASIILTTSAHAKRGGYQHDYHDSVTERQERQHHRIERGIQNGQLTRREARKLYKKHDRLISLERRYRRDGYLGRKERNKLHDRLDHFSDRIYRLKHNNRERGYHHEHHDERSHGYEMRSYNPFS